MKVTYYGHSCFGVELAGKNLLFDPFITYNELAKGKVDTNSIPSDYILLSHAHEDHCADLIPIAKRTGATVIGCWEIHVWTQAQGHNKTHPMNLGGSWTFDFGKVTLVPAVHSSSFPDGSYGGHPAGFVIEGDGKRFYYAGDTALYSDMKLIARRPVDFAFLPIGDNFTMNYEDAVEAAELINCKTVIGMHYDTFGFIMIDRNKALETFSSTGKQLVLMNIGETREY